MVDKFVEEEKPSMLQRMGIPYKSTKQKAREVLKDIVERDVSELKASIDKLEEKWKENNGPVRLKPYPIHHCPSNHDMR